MKTVRTASIWLLLSLLSLSLVGCRGMPKVADDPTVWKMEARSTDGAWLAAARTDQNGGFGSAYVDTVVTLTKLDGTINWGKPFELLAYANGGPIRKPYVLSEENAGGGVNLQLRWIETRHLVIDYREPLSLTCRL